MPGLVPGIHVFGAPKQEYVDGRDKPGHDGKRESDRAKNYHSDVGFALCHSSFNRMIHSET
jgi:hypothetical protein